MFTRSVVSYPNRGNYGDARWRGNCSGRIIRDLLETYRPSYFSDCMEGSGTSRDVVAEMNREGYQIKYCGLDIHQGFDILTDSLSERLNGQADLIFAHPPYHNIIPYTTHPNDLSRCTSYEDFLSKMERALFNIYEATRGGGRYSILIGDLRRSGEYFPLQAHLVALAPGKLDSVVIKEQHNCMSDASTYSGREPLVRIAHEYLLTWRRDGVVFGVMDAALNTSERLRSFSNCTWKAVIEYALAQLGGRASLIEIYNFVEERAGDRIQSVHWKEKVRQTIRVVATCVERGVYALAGSGAQYQAA